MIEDGQGRGWGDRHLLCFPRRVTTRGRSPTANIAGQLGESWPVNDVVPATGGCVSRRVRCRAPPRDRPPSVARRREVACFDPSVAPVSDLCVQLADRPGTSWTYKITKCFCNELVLAFMNYDEYMAQLRVPVTPDRGICRYCWRERASRKRGRPGDQPRKCCGDHALDEKSGRRWRAIGIWVKENEGHEAVWRSAWARVYDLFTEISSGPPGEIMDVDPWRAGRPGHRQAIQTGGMQTKAAELAALNLTSHERDTWRVRPKESPHAILIAYAHALDEIEREYTAAMGAKRGKQPAEGRRARGRPSKRDKVDLPALRARLASGVPREQLAAEYDVRRSTIWRWLK